MLVSTPTKSYVHRHAPCTTSMSLSPTFNTRHYTPPTFDTPMISPTSRRHRPLFPASASALDSDDQPTSPFSPHSPALAQLPNPFYTSKPQPISADDEEGSIFLSSARDDSASTSPATFALSIPQPLLTPVKQTHRSSNRPALGPASMNTRLGVSATAADPASTSRVGVGTKRKTTPNITPLRPNNLTPLKISSSKDGEGLISFDRLAPLAAPKFTARTPQTKAETEAHLKRQTASLTRLRLSERLSPSDQFEEEDAHDSGCELDDESYHELFLSKPRLGAKGGPLVKPLLFNPPLFKGKENEEVAEAVSPGGHISKRRARSRPVSADLLENSYKVPKSPIKSGLSSKVGPMRPRHSGPVNFPSTAHRGCVSPASSSSSEAGSPRPRRRNNGLSAMHPPRPPMNRHDTVSAATLFFGPAIPAPQSTPAPAPASGPVMRSRTSSNGQATAFGPASSEPRRPAYLANRHSYAGPSSDRPAWTTLQSRTPASPGSSPFGGHADSNEPGNRSLEMDDADMFFAGDDSFNLRVPPLDSPPPHVLPMKYKSLGSDEDEMPSTGSSAGGFVVPKASTSVSSICSDDGLVTPGVTPETASGWPAAASISVFTDEGAEDTHPYGRGDVDAFIVRTLAAASKASSMPKRAPGTPVKKPRMSYFGKQRPWQSAVATKVALRDDPAYMNAPRKSLPAAFAQVGAKAALLNVDRQNTDTEEEGEEESPSVRREKDKYIGLGLGQPTNGRGHPAIQRTQWLMRRSSSGAFSSGSDNMSASSTPTRGKVSDWQLADPRPPLRLSPSRDTLSKTTSRSTSGSSNSSVTTLNSPSDYRRKSLAENATSARAHHHLPPRPSLMTGRRLSDSYTDDQQPGRFERDFEEIEEIGTGEFGKVIKVQNKAGEMFAVKKSKQFEGVKHRLRLLEEVAILKHLRQAAHGRYEGQGHPNVLAYVDSWDENEALYICTELCESGNLARFLWEYGRVYPRLDEARVWKIVVDLSNGLRFIHDAGVIHLDVKPSNVFVTKEGRFKIGDFGMASLWPRPAFLDSAASGVAGGFEREGDKLYLAPEVLQGRYGKAADIFSFGMSILETASNIVVPDQGEGWQRLRREDFSQVDLEEDSPELAALILNMMRTDPDMRFTIDDVCAHPVVRRAREAMERMHYQLLSEGRSTWGASPLAGVPPHFLEEILDREEEGAMDTSL